MKPTPPPWPNGRLLRMGSIGRCIVEVDLRHETEKQMRFFLELARVKMTTNIEAPSNTPSELPRQTGEFGGGVRGGWVDGRGLGLGLEAGS